MITDIDTTDSRPIRVNSCFISHISACAVWACLQGAPLEIKVNVKLFPSLNIDSTMKTYWAGGTEENFDRADPHSANGSDLHSAGTWLETRPKNGLS